MFPDKLINGGIISQTFIDRKPSPGILKTEDKPKKEVIQWLDRKE
jgi:hypothetical protein